MLQSAAEAKAYMQYVAFGAVAHRYVPVLLTDGNNMVLYFHNARHSAHVRMYWDFDQILDASMYLEELVKHIALKTPLMPSCVLGQKDQLDPPEDPGMEHGASCTDAVTTCSTGAGPMSLCQQHCLTETQHADLQEALRLARSHPCVIALYGHPPD